MQAVWKRVHARTSHGRVDGFIGGILRSVLQLRAPEGGRREPELAGIDTLQDQSTPRVRFRDPQVEMAHGAGGKGSRRLVEGLFAPLVCGTTSEPLTDAARLSLNGAQIAITTDSFVVNPLTFPGGSIGE